MKNYSSLIFYYCITVFVTVIIGILFYFSAPQNIILTLLAVPILYFLWLGQESLVKSSGDESQTIDRAVSGARNRMAIVAILACLISLITFTFFPRLLKPKSAISKPASIKQEAKGVTTSIQDQKKQAEMMDLMQRMKNEITNLRSDVQRRDEMLGFVSTSTPISSLEGSLTLLTPTPTSGPPKVAYIKIKSDQWQKVDVFEKSSASSKIVGQAVYGKIYPVMKTEGLFYLINLSSSSSPSSIKGWIHRQFIKEFF